MGGAWENRRGLLWSSTLALLGLAAFLSLWHLAASHSGKLYVPGPLLVASKLYESLLEGVLVENALITLRRIFLAVSIAFVMGLASGLIASRTSAGGALRLLILASYPIPHVTLIPILIWILGVEWSKVAVIALISYYPIAISITEWASRTPREYEDLVRSMGGSRVHIIAYVVLPYIVPGLLTGLRIAVSTAYAVVFIAESFILTGGLGALIEDSWHRLDYPAVYAYVVTLSTLGLASYIAIWAIEKWYRSKFT